jgi:hypothetical protein
VAQHSRGSHKSTLLTRGQSSQPAVFFGGFLLDSSPDKLLSLRRAGESTLAGGLDHLRWIGIPASMDCRIVYVATVPQPQPFTEDEGDSTGPNDDRHGSDKGWYSSIGALQRSRAASRALQLITRMPAMERPPV